jgi:predicted AlkP superfamily pyrophosphatase or phosphodiesterase
MRRVAVILADGLRPDAVRAAPMPSLEALGRDYARAVNVRTVRPSVTVAALASLATGIGPGTHGLIEPGLAFLGRLSGLRPLPRELGRHGLATAVVTGALARGAAPVTAALSAVAGVGRLLTLGRSARETAVAARETFERLPAGLMFVYLSDCDRAGHASGWMSDEYLRAAAEVDTAIGLFASGLGDATLLVVSDHGGGGVDPRDHDLPHPVNDAIPLVIAGRGVRRHRLLTDPHSLLDIPATILWRLGVPVPEVYEGRPIREAFLHESLTASGAAA